MKNVGIMTWYHYRNYGSVLQATALFRAIGQLGYDPFLIQYHPREAVCKAPEYTLSEILKKIKRHLRPGDAAYGTAELEKKFDDFLEKHSEQTAPAETFPALVQLEQKLNAVVCGSDQIWAPSCFDDKYFLSFVAEPQKMVAYAPSIGLNRIEAPEIRQQMRQLISRFQHLSIREIQGAALVKSLTGQDAQVVADPTLLFDQNAWAQWTDISKCSIPEQESPYLLCYFLGNERRYMRAVRKMAKRYGLRILLIPATQRQKTLSECISEAMGPEEFVNLVKHATYIATDSFHGMAFAINFNIPFTVFKRFRDEDSKGQNSRIYSLLQILSLEDRLEKIPTTEKVYEGCDFEQANIRLTKLRERSWEYLRTALEQAVSVTLSEKKKPLDQRIDMCCGCGSCAAVCPTGAITIQRNSTGFWHYKLDADKCVSCGKCRQVCPCYQTEEPSLRDAKHLYAYRTSREATLERSSSGGAGHEIASALSAEGVWISGVVYDPAARGAKHVLIEPGQTEQLAALQGSKYVQSDSASAVKEILALAKEERVAFFGTPCQVAGLDRALRSLGRRSNAVLVDLICHGVPTQFLLERYLEELSVQHQMKGEPDVEFRSHESAWRDLRIRVDDGAKVYSQSEKKDPFYVFFRHSLCYQPMCYDCPYRESSAADIRMGDYWGPRFQLETKGVSMLLANTECGEALLRKLPGKLEAYPVSEYWSVQYPKSPAKPVFYDELLRALADGDRSLSQLRKEYASGFEAGERVSGLKKKLKAWIGR